MLPVDRVQKDMFGADRHQTATHAAINDSLSRPLADIIRADVDQALQMLKQKLPCKGIDRELRLRQHYDKTSEKRARLRAAAINRARTAGRKRAERDCRPSRSR